MCSPNFVREREDGKKKITDILLDLIKSNKTTNFNPKKKKNFRPHVYVSYNIYDLYGTHLWTYQMIHEHLSYVLMIQNFLCMIQYVSYDIHIAYRTILITMSIATTVTTSFFLLLCIYILNL